MFCQHMQGAQSICVIEAHSSNNILPAPPSLSLPWKPVVMAPTREHQEQKFPVQYFVCGICAFQICVCISVLCMCASMRWLL